jgi:hypothetical protein
MPPSISLKGKGTTTRAIRITKDLDRILQHEAERRNVSINGLISSVLTKFAEWDRYAEGFGLATLSREILRKLTNLASEELIAKAGSELGPELLRSEVIFWYKQATLQTFLEWFDLFSKYSGLHKASITKTDGDYVIVIRHEMGEKWSLFLKNYFESAFKARLGIASETEISEFQVSLRLRNISI